MSTRSRRRPLIRRGYAAIAAAGVVFGSVAGGLSLVDWLQKQFKDEPPAVIDARISAVGLRDAAEPLQEYLRDTRQPTSQFTQPQLDQRGYVFNVGLAIKGSVGRELYLRWSMYRAADGTRLHGPTYNQIAADVKPESESHTRTWRTWVPPAPAAGKYFVRFILEDEERQPVSEADTRPFDHSG